MKARTPIAAVFLAILYLVSAVPPSHESHSNQPIKDEMHAGKRRLAQSSLKSELQNRDAVHLKHAFTKRFKGNLEGSSASTFHSFNQSFVLVDRVLYSLATSLDESQFNVNPVAKFQEFLGKVALVESVEWDGLLFLLAGYEQGLLQLFTVSPNNEVTLRQTIDCDGIPIGAEFFQQNENLYLVVASNNGSLKTPLKVYQWIGSQLDEQNKVFETQATAVTTFPFRESVIIVVAVGGASLRKEGLAVFKYTGNQIQMVQFLPLPDPFGLHHYSFRSENFLLVTSASGRNVICWWSGSDLITWSVLQSESLVHSVGVAYIDEETVLALVEKVTITFYRPTDSALQFINVYQFNTSVHSVSLHMHDKSLSVLAIPESNGNVTPLLLELNLVFQPPAASFKNVASDPLLQCLSDVQTGIKLRDSQLQKIRIHAAQLVSKNLPGRFKGKLVVKKLQLNKAHIHSQEVIPDARSTRAANLKKKTEELKEYSNRLSSSLGKVVFKSESSILSGRLLVAKELTIKNAMMESVFIPNLNGQRFDPDNILMYKKDQEISGTVSVDKFISDKIVLGSLNGVKVDDFLRKNGDQVVSGLEEVTNVSAKRIVFRSRSPAVNNITLQRIVTSVKSPNVVPVSGIKTFAGLNLNQLAVNLLNNVNFTDWINSLQPINPLPLPTKSAGSVVGKVQTINDKLNLQNLTVLGSINGVPFNDLISDLFLIGLRQNITGELITKGLTVKNLIAPSVNQVRFESLMTKNTNQRLIGSLSLDSLSTPHLICEDINGLKLSSDAAYVNAPVPVTTPVVFDKLQSTELYLPRQATIAGEIIGERLQTQPKIVYEGTLTIKGALRLTDADFSNADVQIRHKTVNVTNLGLLYWTRYSDQIIRDSVHASKGLHVSSLSVKTINNHGIERYVDLSATQVLRGKWHFSSAAITGNIVHEPKAKQIPVSLKQLSSVVVKNSGDYNITGLKIFSGGVKTEHLVTQYIDSMKVSDILVQKPKKGNLMHNEVWIGGNLIIRSNLNVGSVNGIDFCKRLKKAVLIDRDSSIRIATIAAVSSSNITVQTINEVPFSNILKSHSNPVQSFSKIVIRGDVSVDSLSKVKTINGKQFTWDYLTRVVDRTKSGAISGKKTFTSHFGVLGTFDALHLNGMNLKLLYDKMLSKTRSQTISARIKMDEVEANMLMASIINDVEIRNLVTSDSLRAQIIEGDITFTSPVEVQSHLSTTMFQDNCNLTLVNERLQTLDEREWKSLVVEGNLHWINSLPNRHGLGYYLDSAVTKGTNQMISAEVNFAGNVSVSNFESTKDINDIAIKEILRDSVRKSSFVQVVKGSMMFKKQLSSRSMNVMGNVNAKTVATVNIVEFNSSLVRMTGDKDITGHKRFRHGFSGYLLTVNGTVNGLLTSSIANYDQPRLPPISFKGPLEIKGDLDFERVHDLSFVELLRDRVTLHSPQSVQSHITFNRDLTIQGDMVAPRINHLDIADIVLRESMNEQVITGRKNFLHGLRVDGPVEVDLFNRQSLRSAHALALFKDENATIDGDLVLKNYVTLNSNLEVDSTVNGVEMTEVAKLLRRQAFRNDAQARIIARTISDVNSLLNARGDLSEMLYIDPVLDVPVSFTNTFRAVSSHISNHESYVDLFGWASHILCGLPAECACPAQYGIHIQSEDLKFASWNTGLKSNTSERSFTFHFDNPSVKVVLKTNTVSSSSRCRLLGANRLDELSLLSWVEIPDIQVPSATQKQVTQLISPDPIYGYISDVKGMAHQGHIYLFIAIGYSAELDTTDVNSVVVRIDLENQRAVIVAEFPTHGASSLDVFNTSRGYQVAVGNSYDTLRGSSQISLDIYRFDIPSQKMILKKSIPADGIMSVVSIVQGGDDLVIVAQKQLYTPVMVLKYDVKHDDYHFMQQLNPNTVPTGLGAFYIGQPGRSDAFLGVSTTDDQFYLYKFSHIEGFKLFMKMELKGVQGFTTFSVGNRQYLIFTSTSSPSVFEIVKQIS